MVWRGVLVSLRSCPNCRPSRNSIWQKCMLMLLDQRTIVSADLFWLSPHHRQRQVEDDADLAGWLRCRSRPLQLKLEIRFHQPASCTITLGLLLLPVPLLLLMLLLLLLELSVLLRCCLPSPPYSLAPRRQLCCSCRHA